MHTLTLCTVRQIVKDNLESIPSCVYIHMVIQCWYDYDNLMTQITIDQINKNDQPEFLTFECHNTNVRTDLTQWS